MVLFFLWMTAFWSCKQTAAGPAGEDPGFETKPQAFALGTEKLVEASGIADGKVNRGMLWVEQDSGNPPDLFLIKHNGEFVKTVNLAGVDNRDWEDIVCSAGPQPGKSYLYVAETGDNLMVHSDYAIYRLPEPDASVDTVRQVDKIAFFYPDGSHNCEAILVDPATKDIYLITKTDLHSKIFKLGWPYSTTEMNKAEEVGSLPYNFAVSAALSPTGREVVVKTYSQIFCYLRKPGETILQALQKKPYLLPYEAEPQGEAVVFANDNSGYYTISEKTFGAKVKLYFYKRK